MMGYYQQTEAPGTTYQVQRADGKWLTKWGGWSIWRADAQAFDTMTEATLGANEATHRPDWVIVPVAQAAHEAA